MMFSGSAALLALVVYTSAQTPLPPVPSSSPHNYTGIPPGSYSPEWQKYFRVTNSLTNVSWHSPSSYAGNIAVNRKNHPNDTLFFWAFEREEGSLTIDADYESHKNDHWTIWLNGGPGSSSMIGLLTENGPIRFTNTFAVEKNNYSWHSLSDIFYIDQPVGTGYATADSKGYIADEDQMAEDFLGFLANLVLVFPSLAKRPLYLTGESYAGVYIPYITKAILSSPNPPVYLKKFAIGDGAMGSLAAFEELPIVEVIETYPQLIDFDLDVYEYFKTQRHICGYDLNLTYPQIGHFPTLANPFTTLPDSVAEVYIARQQRRRTMFSALLLESSQDKAASVLTKRQLEQREERKRIWKRDLSGRTNGTLDPWYGCFLFDELFDYALNFTFPWTNGMVDPYNVPDALNPEAPMNPQLFMNDARNREALHAPQDKNWTFSFLPSYPFNSTFPVFGAPGNEFGDPSVEPMAFLSELAANASAHDVEMIFYSGNDDMLVAHRGTEATVQNMTFGGAQGFTRKPSTPWYDDDGQFAGIIHQERSVLYALFDGSGHFVPAQKPKAALKFFREFILGNNPLGRVAVSPEGKTTVVGGEKTALAGDVIPGNPAIYYGSGTTQFSTVAPSSALASWFSMLSTATPTATPAVETTQSSASGALPAATATMKKP